MIVFHTDLDNTLIYSYRHDIGEEKRCAEVYQGREISFMTQETYRLLQKLRHIEQETSQVLIVPTTTRTIEQYRRIDLGVGALQYALVCNGGVLLVRGREEESWYRESLALIRDSSEELNKALELLEREKRRIFDLRLIRGLFVFTKCEEPESVVDALRKMLDTKTVDVFNNGVKVYVVPKSLNKGKAVERFRDYVRSDYVIAAGDSEFDISMLEAADMGIAAPELAQRVFGSEKCFSDRIICPAAETLYAEAVLNAVLQLITPRLL